LPCLQWRRDGGPGGSGGGGGGGGGGGRHVESERVLRVCSVRSSSHEPVERAGEEQDEAGKEASDIEEGAEGRAQNNSREALKDPY